MSGILGEIVTEIVARQTDMEIVARVSDVCDVVSTSRRSSQDVLIALFDEESDLPEAWRQLLDQAGVKLLAIRSDGCRASLYRLRPEQVPIGDLSPAALVDVIRVQASNVEGPE